MVVGYGLTTTVITLMYCLEKTVESIPSAIKTAYRYQVSNLHYCVYFIFSFKFILNISFIKIVYIILAYSQLPTNLIAFILFYGYSPNAANSLARIIFLTLSTGVG